MLNIKELLTGGQKVADAKDIVQRDGNRKHLSAHRRERVDEARQILWRQHLRKDVAVGIGALTSLGGLSLLWKLYPAVQSDGSSPNPIYAATAPDRTVGTSERADQIRAQIRGFEKRHANRSVNKETIQQLLSFTSSLYQEVFNRSSREVQLSIVSSDDRIRLRRQKNLPIPITDDPSIDLTIASDKATMYVFLGNPEKADPTVQRISVFRGLLMHAFVGSQAVIRDYRRTVNVGGEEFSALGAHGFVWTTGRSEARGALFDKLNTQLLAEHLNDPSGNDDIYRRIVESPVYRNSLLPIYVKGAQDLRQFYDHVGMPIEEVGSLYFQSQPDELFGRIDMRAIPRQLIFPPPQPASAVLLNLHQTDALSEEGLRPLKALTQRTAPAYY